MSRASTPETDQFTLPHPPVRARRLPRDASTASTDASSIASSAAASTARHDARARDSRDARRDSVRESTRVRSAEFRSVRCRARRARGGVARRAREDAGARGRVPSRHFSARVGRFDSFDSFVVMSTLDAVFATCARTLARRASSSSAPSASAPSPGVAARAAREISDALDAVRLADVSRALDAYAARARERDALGARGRLQPCVTYLGLRAEREYSIGAFVFDASQTMPLHNHPGMTVFMRALFGSATVTSYDLVSCVDASGGSVESHLSAANAMEGRGRAFDAKFAGRARLAGGDGVSAASSSTIMLTPTRANVHTITAMTACAILEVQTPPYAVGHGRDCHYFEFVDTETEGMNRNFGDDGRRLREIGPSPSYVCRPFPSDDHEHSLAR